MYAGIPTTIKTMSVNIATVAYLRVLIIEIGSTIILMVVEAQGIHRMYGTFTHVWMIFMINVGAVYQSHGSNWIPGYFSIQKNLLNHVKFQHLYIYIYTKKTMGLGKRRFLSNMY